MSRQGNETRYLITETSSIPIIRIGKGEAYKIATKPGWGVVEWYSAVNNYSAPVNRDKEDKTQQLICDEDTSAVLYPRYGREFCIFPYEEISMKDAPKQAEVEAVVISDSCGFTFWEHESGDIKIFVTYDKNGLPDTYRLDNWAGKPYDDEVEITFGELQSQEDYDNTDRADIHGTWEYFHKRDR